MISVLRDDNRCLGFILSSCRGFQALDAICSFGNVATMSRVVS
jgi:hypothetical protein